jgi:hypothetical protein
MNRKITTLLAAVALVAGMALSSSNALAGENAKAQYTHLRSANFFRLDAAYADPQRRAFTWIDIQALRAFTRMF